ncbi:FAS1 domain-containing protein [Stemphylium lycopersici]|uniref:FAS1 domain-containing protein n=1 Tax=Stemphylium lycopersici TaxID=183478 RepID=A0A364N521_STELY|nr:FAS1 domain-containing protein [Stemphylium lycopersici]RAR12190.1 FAS1 domain-containing protein [Stemphylium lycopersici]
MVEPDTTAPLLTAISEDPGLSIFYSLFNSTGGSSGIPGPQFEEQFNSLMDGRKFTAFAPVNSAFENLTQDLSAALTSVASYSLLEFILRSHIALGSITTEDVRTPGKSITSIQGTPLTFNFAGDAVLVNDQARLTSTSRTVVGNGVIFKITSVLDSFVGLFGADFNKTTSTTSASKQASLVPVSIGSALASSPDLSIYMELLSATSPDFVYLLDGPFAQNRNLSVFAPRNVVFQALGMTAKAFQPSNQALDSYLLKYPFIHTTPSGRDMSILGLPATVRRDRDGGITSVNNAAVEGERYCVSNACVDNGGWLCIPKGRAFETLGAKKTAKMHPSKGHDAEERKAAAPLDKRPAVYSTEAAGGGKKNTDHRMTHDKTAGAVSTAKQPQSKT